MAFIHVAMLWDLAGPEIFEVGGDEMGKKVVLALPALAAQPALDPGFNAP